MTFLRALTFSSHRFGAIFNFWSLGVGSPKLDVKMGSSIFGNVSIVLMFITKCSNMFCDFRAGTSVPMILVRSLPTAVLVSFMHDSFVYGIFVMFCMLCLCGMLEMLGTFRIFRLALSGDLIR